jgi:iron complex transport system permease protein
LLKDSNGEQQKAIQNNEEKKIARKKIMLLALPVLAFLLSFPVGRYAIAPGDLITILLAKILPIPHTWPSTLDTAVFQVRLPRIVAAMLVGAALSTAGAAYQGMFKNPLVSPDILGATAGAAFGAALGIYFNFGVVGIQLSSFVFGLAAVGLAYLVGGRIRHDPILALVLAGILISTIFSSSTSLLKYMADPYEKLPTITYWLLGSLSSIAPEDIWFIIGPMLLGFTPLYLLRWRLNVLSMGEEEAKALGLETDRLRITVILCSTLITAAAVSISGMIGFVGLVIPHLTRMIVGPDYKTLIPASMLVGSAYLVVVDDLARVLSTVEVPLGILTSVIGAPFFIYLILRSKGGWQ